MKLKKKNKGFSLVELIVVMAIMAILAVTLAPTLTQYVEKSRKAADREVINSIYTTVEYALLDESISKAVADAKTAEAATPGSGFNLEAGLSLNSADGVDAITEVYEVNSDGKWTMNSTSTLNGATNVANSLTPYTSASNVFIQEIYKVVGNFKLKSTEADASSDIEISYTGGVLTVLLKYDRATADASADYTVSSNDVR